jgi:predicted O-linked N-acetylglucosamine transferase (SPINDLY family)
MESISKALAIAIEHHQGGRLRQAEEIYQQILQVEPNQADAIHLLGVIAYQGQKLDEAIARFRRALGMRPDHAEAHNSLGVALKAKGKLDEAVACCRQALELKPNYVEAHNNQGNALLDQGNLDAAVASYRRALELRPDYSEAHNNLGFALKAQGSLEEAIGCFRRSLELNSDCTQTHNNLGTAFYDAGNLQEAVRSWRRALELKPGSLDTCLNLAAALWELGNLNESVAFSRRALELNSECAEAHNNLGIALNAQGRPAEALTCFHRALELKPDYAYAHSNQLYALQYCEGANPGALAEAHAAFDRQHAVPLRTLVPFHEHVPYRSGRPRLGFVSPDLGRHPVGYFLVRVLENLREQEHEVFCYSDRIVTDDMTRRFQGAATLWRDVRRTSDERLAAQIRADRIDILFDLAGHTGRNRLLVFARKPAPIQITWIGYEGTTGLSAMDYLLADRHMIPQRSECYYREKVLRMPDGYLCYDPPGAAPPVGPLPLSKNGYATFGSFNNPAKITPDVVAVWAEILRRDPTARMVLKYRGLGDGHVKQRYLEFFIAHDVEPQRLEFLPASSYTEYLATYHQVDIVLDTFPFSGSTTTCEALWMGVPVITSPGETFASRHSLTHLANAGLNETIARNRDEYVELAVSLAGDLTRLAALRAGLRERMANSPLCDGQRFATNLASLLMDIWKQRTAPAGHSPPDV